MSSDEENDEIQDPEKIRDKILKMHQGERMQASAWDDDNTGVESRRNPEDPDSLAILKAAANGNIGRVVKLVEENPTLVHVTDKDGYTPLHRACYRNYTSIVKYLLLKGAKINARTIDGWEPMHSACHHVESIKILIAFGADVNAKNNDDQNALHLACGAPHPPSLENFTY